MKHIFIHDPTKIKPANANAVLFDKVLSQIETKIHELQCWKCEEAKEHPSHYVIEFPTNPPKAIRQRFCEEDLVE